MKKLLSLFGIISLTAVASSTVVACGGNYQRDYFKISLDMLANGQMEKLYVKNLDTIPDESVLKTAISRALETYELRLTDETFDENIEIQWYDNTFSEIPSFVTGDSYYYSLKATDNSEYFSGESEIITSKITEVNDKQLIDLADPTKVATDYSKYTFNVNDEAYFRYVVMDESYIFGGLRLLLNDYQATVEFDVEAKTATISATDHSDRLKEGSKLVLENINFV